MKKDLEKLLDTIKEQLANQREIRESYSVMTHEYEVASVLVSRMEWEITVLRDIIDKNSKLKICKCSDNKQCKDGGLY
jgi:hypothetical protein